MLGFQAHAAKDAFAAHKMALETLIPESENAYHTPVHHGRRVYDHERSYVVDEPVHDVAYDAYDHDYDTERKEYLSYRHHGDDEFTSEYDQSCGKKEYCHRFAQYLARGHHEYRGHQEYASEHHMYENGMAQNHLMTAYYVEPDSVVVHEDAIVCSLHLHDHEYYSNSVEFRANHLDLHMALFQEGIMQVKIKASEEEERFSISNTGIGVDWDQIKVQQHMQDFVKILDDGILISGQDKVSYKVQFDPFRIIQYVDGKETVIVNDNDNLYYDAKNIDNHYREHANAAAKKEAAPAAKKPAEAKKDVSSQNINGYSVGMDFTVNASHMYGIPQRNDNFRLEETGYSHPYRLFN